MLISILFQRLLNVPIVHNLSLVSLSIHLHSDEDLLIHLIITVRPCLPLRHLSTINQTSLAAEELLLFQRLHPQSLQQIR